MGQVVDYSGRRGVIVHLLPQIYAILNENPDRHEKNIVLWTQDMHAALLDLQRRWLFVLDSDEFSPISPPLNVTKQTPLMGFMFYRLVNDSVYIDELQIARRFQSGSMVFPLLLNKFQQNAEVKKQESFYASIHIKKEEADEILASVGLPEKNVYTDGYQSLGTLADTVKALKIRYVK